MARIINIKGFDFSKPTVAVPDQQDNILHFPSATNRLKWIDTDEFSCETYPFFPAILDSNGSPWYEGCCFILDSFKWISPPPYRTLEGVAEDLKKFKSWCEVNNVDYKSRSDFKSGNPTYKFCRFLNDCISQGELASKTACRVMGRVQQFYRWLYFSERIETLEGLWLEDQKSVSFINRNGDKQYKNTISTDLLKYLSRAVQKQQDDYIQDGGKLKPLKNSEQTLLKNVLQKSPNIEMRLAITIAISTGARLSTVFTLRQKHFLASLDSDEPYKLIKIGGNSLVKNKNDKQMMLLIPRSVYFWAQTYITSPRYKKRLAVSEHEFKQSVHEYMFLKNNGKAYFMTERDANVVKYNKPPRGGDVQQFISKSLNTKLRQLKNGFQFRFHDLRATFGINILEWELRRLKYSDDRSDKELFNLLNFIRERMGHEKMATTEAYLRFHSSQARQQIVQAEYESYMLDWLQ